MGRKRGGREGGRKVGREETGKGKGRKREGGREGGNSLKLASWLSRIHNIDLRRPEECDFAVVLMTSRTDPRQETTSMGRAGVQLPAHIHGNRP